MTAVSFEPLAGACPNPERGLCRFTATAPWRPDPLQSTRLRLWRESSGITLVFRHVGLPRRWDGDLGQEILEGIESDFAALREAGLKCVLRFSYGPGGTDGLSAPHGDAPKESVLRHIRTVAPVIHENLDVLAVLQAGFIGRWGEWYYTDHFGDPARPAEVSPRHLADRREVLAALLDAVDARRKIQVRSVPLKRALLDLAAGSPSTLTADEAHGSSPRARIGFHNDCFLSDRTDTGTYDARAILQDRRFLALEGRFVPVGGETCRPAGRRVSGAFALGEMERYHWSYLNRDYHPEVIRAWREDGTLDEVRKKLGYRLELQDAFLSRTPDGRAEQLTVRLVNRGWAPPYNPRMVRIVLRGGDSDREHSLALDADPRFWMPGEPVELAVPLRLPPGAAPGRYGLLLHLPDPEPSLSRRPEYAVRFANQDVWEPATGYNRLGLTVELARGSGGRYSLPPSRSSRGARRRTFSAA